jgi:hypothetical protein
LANFAKNAKNRATFNKIPKTQRRMQSDNFLKTLEDKEAELTEKLHQSSIWKQILGIRSTIQLFKEGDNPIKETNHVEVVGQAPYPSNGNGTWEQRIIWVLNKINSGFVEDVMEEIQANEPGTFDKETLYKRVSQNCSVLKSDGKIRGVPESGKMRYFNKK